MNALPFPKATSAIVPAIRVGHDLIGAVLNQPLAIDEAADIAPGQFPDPVQTAIWAEIVDVAKDSGEIPVSIIASRLATDPLFTERGGLNYLAAMADQAPPAVAIPGLVADLIKSWRARRTKELAAQVAQLVDRSEPIEHVLSWYSAEFDHLTALPSGRLRFVPEPFETMAPSVSPWLVKGVLPAAGVAFIVGVTKSGKSFVTIDTCLRLAAGAPKVFGRKAKQTGCLYVAAEDAAGCRARVAAWRVRHHRETPMPFELIGRSVNLLDPAAVTDLVGVAKSSSERFRDKGSELGVIVFDTFARCTPGGDENSSADMGRAFHVLEEIARSTGALVLVVAHHGKGGAEKGIRGWSGLDANSDATISVERSQDEPELRTITFSKVKNGVDGGQVAFRLEEVGLGVFDEDGDELKSCVPVYEPASDAPVKRGKALTAPQQIVFDAIRFITSNGPTEDLPADVEGKKPWMKAVAKSAVKDRAIQAGLAGDDKPNAVRMRFERALEALTAARKIRQEGDLVWLLS